MTHSPSHRRRLEWTRVALALSCALACAAQPAPRAVAPDAPAPPPPMVSDEPASDEATTNAPASTEPPPESSSAENVVTLIAKPGLWPLDVDSARRVLGALGPVEREQPTPNDLSLVGGRFGALDRFDVAYALDGERYWVFGSAGFVLAEPDPARLYHTLHARLSHLLGKPFWTSGESDGALPAAAWDIGEDMTLQLAPSGDGKACWVKIEAVDTRRRAEMKRAAPRRTAAQAPSD